jgi:hypothetical protein
MEWYRPHEWFHVRKWNKTSSLDTEDVIKELKTVQYKIIEASEQQFSMKSGYL